MNKIRKIISFEKLDQEVIEAIIKKYPDGWKNHIKKINKGNGEFFYAIDIDYGVYSYLVKVNVKVDSLSDLEKEDEKEDDNFDEIPEDEIDVEFDEEKDYDD